MPHAGLATLQATVNRFAPVADFSPLVIDGGMGSATEVAVQNALVWACEQGALSGLGAATISPVKLWKQRRALSGLGFEPPQQVTPSRSNACNLRTRMDDAFGGGGGQTFIMQNLTALDNALSGVAAERGLKAPVLVAVNQSSGSGGSFNTPTPNKAAFTVKPAPDASTFDKGRLWFRQLPTYQQAGLGVGALFMAMAGWGAYKAKSSLKSGS